MKLARISLSGASVALLAIQLALVASIAGKYLYQRWQCPRVWARAVAADPELPMRGRYLSLQLTVDGCRSTLPTAFHAVFQRDINGVAGGKTYTISAGQAVQFPAQLKVIDNRLAALRIPDSDSRAAGVMVSALPGSSCAEMRLDEPVDFFLAGSAAAPARLGPSQDLWVEVTVPPSGPPRPLQLALKDNGVWKPLATE
jgi:hypothetical protein